MQTPDRLLPSYYGYIGSKSSFCGELNRRMPPEASLAYCEPFLGGAGAFLGKPKAKVNILNDIDSDILETHATVAANPSGVMGALEQLRPSRHTFEQLREERHTSHWFSRTLEARAAAVIYLLKNSVNGKMGSFSISGQHCSSFNPHYDLRPYAAKFDNVIFENSHWLDLVNRLVFKPKDVTLFLYCDPPYVIAETKQHYRHNFDSVDHILLARTLTRISELNNNAARNVKVMISYDDDPDGFVRSLYREDLGWRIQTIPVRYASENGSSGSRTELLIMNYDPPTCAGAPASPYPNGKQ